MPKEKTEYQKEISDLTKKNLSNDTFIGEFILFLARHRVTFNKYHAVFEESNERCNYFDFYVMKNIKNETPCDYIDIRDCKSSGDLEISILGPSYARSPRLEKSNPLYAKFVESIVVDEMVPPNYVEVQPGPNYNLMNVNNVTGRSYIKK